MSWSRKYACCIECGTTEKEHLAKGVCKACYYKQYYKDNKEKIKQRSKQYREDNKEIINQRSKQYRKNNPEKEKQRHKRYREDNREQINQRHRQWNKDNEEKIKQYNKDNRKYINQRQKQYRKDNKKKIRQYNKDNPERTKAANNHRRARKINAGGDHTGEDIKFLLYISNNKCQQCGETERLEIDHIIPLSGGGRNGIFNLQVLCKPCNLSKGAHHSTDYRSLEFKQAVSRYAYSNIIAYDNYPLQLESSQRMLA